MLVNKKKKGENMKIAEPQTSQGLESIGGGVKALSTKGFGLLH